MRRSFARQTICTWTLRRWFVLFAVRCWSWTGISVPSTIHSSRRSVGGGPVCGSVRDAEERTELLHGEVGPVGEDGKKARVGER
jgi:hypothetical protein